MKFKSKFSKKLIGVKPSLPISMAISFSLIFTPTFSFAEILPDKNSPIASRPTILKTPNNAIQVDIVKPNNKGVSINEYSKFNTTDDGTILNNSRNGADTITGGYIHANPRLSEGSAKLIVNKINSDKKSSLKGNIEIAGDKADLMIANPSGIDIDGVHFINSKSTTLTTGELKFKDGALNKIDVNKGEISINNNGLKDESDYLNIISYSTKINANIHANEINIITGKNSISEDKKITKLNGSDKDTKTNNKSNDEDIKFLIDSSNLGGMYANKIKLIGTKEGLGVNNQGKIIANSSVKIDTNGNLINNGEIISNNNINIKAENIKNIGNDKSKALLKSQSLNINSNSINNKNSIIQTDSKLNIRSNNLINKNSVIGKESLNNQEDKKDNNKNTNSDTKENTTNKNKDKNNNRSQIIIKDTIFNENSKILSNELNLNISEDIFNENSNLNILSINDKLNSINNKNSNFIIDKDVNLDLNDFTQKSSKFHSNGNLFINSNKDINNKSSSNISSLKNISLTSNENIFNENSQIISNNNISLNANKDINNINSRISSNKNISLNVKEDINNINSILSSNKINTYSNNMFLTTSKFIADSSIGIRVLNDLNSDKSDIVSNNVININSNNNLNLNLSSLLSGGNAFIKASCLYTNKEIVSNNNLNIASKEIKNQGDIKAKNIAINSSLINNDKDSNIISYDSLDIKADMLNNRNLIYASNSAFIKADDIINKDTSDKGIFSKDLKITSVNLNNSNGNIISNKLLDIKIKDSLNNTLGYIGAYLDLNLNSSLLNNKDGFIISNKNLFINTDKYSNHGNLQAGNNLSLITKDTIDYNGGFYANKDIFIKTTDDFINNTKLISNNNLIINANNITNKGTIHSLNDMSLNSYLNLNNFGEIASNKNLFINSNYLMNNKANIYSNKALIINSNDILNIDKSTLYSKDDMILNTNTLINKDSSNIISDKNLNIFYVKDKISDDNILILNDDNYKNYKSSKIDNLSSLMYSESDMNINAKELNNRSLDELKVVKEKIKKTIYLGCDGWGGFECSNAVLNLSVDKNTVLKIKNEILDKYNNQIDDKTLNNELIKKLTPLDETLYVLTEFNNENLPGESEKFIKNIYIDTKNNQITVSRGKPHKKEEGREIRYTFTKEHIDKDSLAKFRPSNIISKGNINFLTNNLLNDKSIVFANKDINLKDTNLINQGLDLNYEMNAKGEYRWKHKSHSGKGGYTSTKQKNYSLTGYSSIFAANGKITGTLTNLDNKKPNSTDIIINKTPDFMKDDKDISYKSLLGYNQTLISHQNIDSNNIENKDFKNPYESKDLNKQDLTRTVSLSKDNVFIINAKNPIFKDNKINPTDKRHYYLNTSYIFDENIPNSDYMHNKLTSIYNFRNSALKSILFKDGKPIDASSLIYAGDGISLDIDGNLNNYSGIISNNYIKINANNITNKFADIKANNELILNANNDILNLSSYIKAGSVYLNANNIVNQTLSNTNTLTHSYGKESFTNIADISTITSTKGDTVLNAKDSIYLIGSNINSNKNIALFANNNILSETVKDKGSYDFSMSGGYYKREYEYNIGSNLNAKENILLKANKDITLISSNLNSNKDIEINAGDNINILSSTNSDYNEIKSTSKGFMSKKTELIKSLQQEVKSSNIDGENIYINANNGINLQSVNLIANQSSNKKDLNDNINNSKNGNKGTISIVSNNGNINIASASYTNYYDKQTDKSSFGGLSKSSSKINDTTISQSSSNLFSANSINLKANNINVIASNLKSTNIDIQAKLLNLISSKETNSHTEFKTRSGIITATIEDKGSIKEIEIPSIIQVDNKFILNGKDITNKLDTKTYTEISNSLNSFELKENVLKELSSNKTLNIKEINQIKATLNSKEWNDKTTTLSGIGTLIATAVTTYLTAGAGSAFAASLGTTGASAATTAAVTNAVIANTSIQASNMILSNGKVKFDIDSLTKSALSAGIGSMASSYINSSTYLTNSNLINSNYLDISYADIANTLSSSAIQSGIYGTNFKDSLLSNISSSTGNYLFKKAGDIGLITNSKDGSLTKTALHSLVGGSINAIQGESFLDGAIISGINELLTPLSSNLNKDEQILTSQLTGILTGALINSEAGAKQGYNLTTSAEMYNRQLHKGDMKKIKELSKLYAKKKNISLDEATNVIAKGYYALVDNDANEFYIKNLDEDKAVEVLNSQDFIKNNLDYSKTAFIDNNELTGVGFATKEQYYNRYSNLKGYAENKDFYNKYLGIDGITNNTKISGLNLAQGVYKPYKDLTHQVITNPLNTAKDMLIAMLNPINSGYEYGNNLRQTYEKANLDKFLNDTTNTNRHYGELTGSLAPVVIPSVGVGISKGIKSGSKVYKNIANETDSIKIQFGGNKNAQYHAERHIKQDTTLDINMVKKEIKNDFISKIDKNQKSYKIKLGKYNLEYRVYKLQDGTYNIGRITVEK
ncbi:two-partner secretion domain-containing protein [Campylobacter hominis]|uniref:Haemagglutination activity domain protein n=1 Tax=Campylobacter hominis (strain ATCC BAA-381 / DSM 21671 / CCUG 45161 / LMG 19568 / NCTC 13146 / CH001A) TaxID=360107 RepID=A7I3H7_CAMHC|nr:hemagglutinin repeat-containing protein [Campylobacter hominis]ABS51217.1 haemagglutination activity domain protein [Campylobacter hominis ATCC BAA-381]UAK85718.1 hemagglutinin repeat-containing protein [Campylobacter hominis]SUW85580.1 hemagglutination activity domain-containing protein [Campylobacter hominis]